jgi:hypothetical protein
MKVEQTDERGKGPDWVNGDSVEKFSVKRHDNAQAHRKLVGCKSARN